MDVTTVLDKAIALYGREFVSDELDVCMKTLKKYEQGDIPKPDLVLNAARGLLSRRPAHEPLRDGRWFRFIDLFAGIGGIRRGFETIGGQCVFTSEWDEYAQKTYRANYPDDAHPIAGDITKVDTANIPDHDVLLAGFPCQPFSIAGVSKKNSLGRAHGFECDTQGTLFFDVARIIADKRPKAFLLENVKNLKSHDRGKTFRIIRRTLEEELGYRIDVRIIDAKGFVPQHRERIFIVGFRDDTRFSFNDFRPPAPDSKVMADVLHPEDGSEAPEKHYTTGDLARVDERYILSDKLWGYLQNYAQKHKAAGNGFGFGKVTPDMTARTLSARYYKDGSEILVDRGEGKNPRRLTPRECARLMGYGDDLIIPVSDTRAYKQFGNSVVVPVITAIAQLMEPHLRTAMEKDDVLQYELNLPVSA
jgi:DNA (cytosine-5)-methyltransferase 1